MLPVPLALPPWLFLSLGLVITLPFGGIFNHIHHARAHDLGHFAKLFRTLGGRGRGNHLIVRLVARKLAQGAVAFFRIGMVKLPLGLLMCKAEIQMPFWRAKSFTSLGPMFTEAYLSPLERASIGNQQDKARGIIAPVEGFNGLVHASQRILVKVVA